MRRFISLSLLAASILIAYPLALQADTSKKIFMYVRDGSRDLDLMLTQEVGVMRTMLEDAGYTVDIATPADAPMVADSASLNPTIKLADVRIEHYAGVILPCMAPAQGHEMPARVDELAAEAVALGLPFAASRGSVTTLAKAGGVENRQFAFAADPEGRPEFAGGTFLGTGVVSDQQISTAGICPLASRSLDLPDGTVDLTRSFIKSLGEAS
jgi:putative intracellular protease/amidase